MGKKNFLYVEYKYPFEPWYEYDRTQDNEWAKVQYERMVKEFPGAEYRIQSR